MQYGEKRDSWGRTESDRERERLERRYMRLDHEASIILDRVSRSHKPTAWAIREAEVACAKAQEAFDRWLAACEHKRQSA